MNKIIIVKGLPASGKTTYAKFIVQDKKGTTMRVSCDEIREMINGNYWPKKNENLVLRIRNYIILEALLSGHDIIIDDPNLNPVIEFEIRRRFSHIAKIETKDFTHVSLETCIDRNSARERKVPTDVIIDLYEKYINGKH